MLKLTSIQKDASLIDSLPGEISESIGSLLKDACVEVIHMGQSDASPMVATLCDMRGGLTAELNPFLDMLEKIDGVLPRTVETALGHTVDTTVLLKQWICTCGNSGDGPLKKPEIDKAAGLKEAMTGPTLLCSSWRIPFVGCAEWVSLFRFLLKLSATVPGLVVRFQVLTGSELLPCLPPSEDLAILERDSVTKSYTVTLPRCLLSPVSRVTAGPQLDVVDRTQRNWWSWVQSLWGPMLNSINEECDTSCDRVLKYLYMHYKDFPPSDGGIPMLDSLVGSHILARSVCSGSNCPHKGETYEHMERVISCISVPGVSIVMKYSDIFRSEIDFIRSAGLPACCAPWANYEPRVSNESDSARTNKPAELLSLSSSILPELSFLVVLSDCDNLYSVWTVLGVFSAIVKGTTDVSRGAYCVHKNNDRLISTKVLLHSACHNWLTRFQSRYISLLFPDGSTKSKKRKRGNNFVGTDKSLPYADDENRELQDLHTVLLFAFQEINWAQLIDENFNVDNSIESIGCSAVHEVIQLWSSKGLTYICNSIIGPPQPSDQFPNRMNYSHLYFMLRILVSIIINGIASYGSDLSDNKILSQLYAHRHRDGSTGIKKFEILINEVVELLGICELMTAVKCHSLCLGEVCQDIVTSNMTHLMLYTISRLRSIDKSNARDDITHEHETLLSLMWEKISLIPTIRRLFNHLIREYSSGV